MSRTYQEHPILFAAYCPGKIMALHANPQNIGIEVFGFALSQDHAGKLNTVHLIHFVNSVTIDDILQGLKVGKEQFPSNVEFSERLRVIESVKEMLDDLQGGKNNPVGTGNKNRRGPEGFPPDVLHAGIPIGAHPNYYLRRYAFALNFPALQYFTMRGEAFIFRHRQHGIFQSRKTLRIAF